MEYEEFKEKLQKDVWHIICEVVEYLFGTPAWVLFLLLLWFTEFLKYTKPESTASYAAVMGCCIFLVGWCLATKLNDINQDIREIKKQITQK